MSLETEIEAAEVGYRCHIDDQLPNQSMYEVFVAGLAVAKSGCREALYRHDHAAADKLLAEITDLTGLAAAAADGLASQRPRFLHSDRPWPLA